MLLALNKVWLCFCCLGVIEHLIRHYRKIGPKIDIRSQLVSFFLSFFSYNLQIGAFIAAQPIYKFLFDRSFFILDSKSLTYWVGLFISHEFLFYWHHRAGHGLPVIWTTHGVHHTSSQMTIFEGMRSIKLGALSFGWVFFGLLTLAGFRPSDVFMMYSATMAFQVLMHTELVGSLGYIDRFLMTPRNHCEHHNIALGKTANYGGMTVFFDRLFGTWKAPGKHRVDYGVFEYQIPTQGVAAAILVPSAWIWSRFESPSRWLRKTLQIRPRTPLRKPTTQKMAS